ncbi:unnamed protein product [Lymnaea stagnalis]|uniref:Uncharacterized protein n=1 Tax=Lymnaea stagnalis TaxID=6523 RepID=A0AAV2H1N7_LYMST
MAFHHEWAWYNLYFPNPDGALCRQHMSDQEWHRMARWRDFEWFNNGGTEANRILTFNRGGMHPYYSADKCSPHLLPPAGAPSSTHARRHPSFYFELFYRMLQERESLVRRGLLPADMPTPGRHEATPTHCSCGKPQRTMTTGDRKEMEAKLCKCTVNQMAKEGWFDGAYSRFS